MMRGEAKTFRANDGSEWTFLFDFEAMVAAEQAADAGFAEVVDGATRGRFGYLRALIWGGLKAHHPRITLPQVAEMIEDEGEALGKALWPAIESAAPKADTANPPKAGRADGTGTRSSPRGSKTASTKPVSGSKRRAASPSS